MNLYGIEICYRLLLFCLAHGFELNLYGIEISIANIWRLRFIVWIEPLWNWNKSRVVRWNDERSVWIEPLWNWNRNVVTALNTGRKFELNLYGIEMTYSCVRNSFINSLNWTFMELKCNKRLRCRCCRYSLNWTFMELKFQRWRVSKCGISVWIEPLWNWNDDVIHCTNWALERLNWTFMELKSHIRFRRCRSISVWIEPLWNWNLVLPIMFLRKKGLNWTFMELKFH